MSLIRKTTKSVTTYSTELNRDDILNLIRAARTVEIPDSAASRAGRRRLVKRSRRHQRRSPDSRLLDHGAGNVIRAWWRRFVKRHIVMDEPEPHEEWTLYMFPGGCVGTALSRKAALAWVTRECDDPRERRAVSRETGEHITRNWKVQP